MRILASPAFSNKKVNPYNALLYSNIKAVNFSHKKNRVHEYSHKKALLEKFDIIHFHWPDAYINPRHMLKCLQRTFMLALIVIVCRLKGSRIVWTVHNVVPHDAHHLTFSHFFMRWFVRQCDGLIFMSEESKAAFFSLYKTKSTTQYTIIPHGHYRTSYPHAIQKSLARKQLGLADDKKVLLFLGMIKPYKNVDALIELFIQARMQDYWLLIAGNTNSAELKEKLQEQAKAAPVKLFLQFIPDDKIHIFFSAADAVVLPYKTILNSGALLLALSFDKPVIAPHIGAFASLQQELGRKWIYSYAGGLQADTLKHALAFLEKQDYTVPCPLENYDWDKLARATVAFYYQLFPLTPTSIQAADS